MNETEKQRADLLSRLDYRTLDRARRDAAGRGDLSMAQACQDAIGVRSKSQTSEIENSGQLFEHVEPPSRNNGGRFVTTYTGDPQAWLAPFTTPGASGKLNRSAGVVARQLVELREGERVQIVNAAGAARTVLGR